jgi:hypothetical protein
MKARVVSWGEVLVVAGCSAPAASPTAAPAKPTDAPKPAAASPAASPVASPAASPAAASSPPPAAGPSPSPAAAAPAPTVSVSTNVGLRRVEVPESARVQQEGKGAPSDLESGALVGITGKPDGTAVVVRLFPQGISPKPEQFPMGGPQAGSMMTNAKIDSFDGRILTVDLGGQKTQITVPPEAEIVKPLPADFADIQPGKRVIAFGTLGRHPPGPDRHHRHPAPGHQGAVGRWRDASAGSRCSE